MQNIIFVTLSVICFISVAYAEYDTSCSSAGVSDGSTCAAVCGGSGSYSTIGDGSSCICINSGVVACTSGTPVLLNAYRQSASPDICLSDECNEACTRSYQLSAKGMAVQVTSTATIPSTCFCYVGEGTMDSVEFGDGSTASLTIDGESVEVVVQNEGITCTGEYSTSDTTTTTTSASTSGSSSSASTVSVSTVLMFVMACIVQFLAF